MYLSDFSLWDRYFVSLRPVGLRLMIPAPVFFAYSTQHEVLIRCPRFFSALYAADTKRKTTTNREVESKRESSAPRSSGEPRRVIGEGKAKARQSMAKKKP